MSTTVAVRVHRREAPGLGATVVSLKLYMDEHVPTAITEGLRQRGIDVFTVQEDLENQVLYLPLR